MLPLVASILRDEEPEEPQPDPVPPPAPSPGEPDPWDRIEEKAEPIREGGGDPDAW
jgi:hypothetical protein